MPDIDYSADIAAATPVMAQYFTIKAAHPDALLFFRMGDFYELFFKDAEIAAATLDIALTRRGQHRGADIPMCGVPVRAAERYLQSLTRAGLRIAICDQTEDPAEARKRGARAVVRREVVRIVSAGTLTEDALLDARAANHLAAFAETGEGAALAWCDLSTGQMRVRRTSRETLSADLARIRPAELVVPERMLDTMTEEDSFAEGAAITPLGAPSFDSDGAGRRLRQAYGVAALDAFGAFSRPELSALGAVLDYVALTQRGAMPALAPPRREDGGATLSLDAATRRNLELTEALGGGRKGSLLQAIDRTVTGAGARLLGEWIGAPLTNPAAITDRLDAIGALIADPALLDDIRATLRRAPDIARALTRLTLDRGAPRDLAALRDGLGAARTIAARLDAGLPALITTAGDACTGHDALITELGAALADELPAALADGGFIAAGYHPPLDEARRLRADSRSVIRDLEGRYREETGIGALKIKHNNVLGWFIETPATHGKAMTTPERAALFIHRQTMANAMRFGTTELADLDRRIAEAAEDALGMERALFAALLSQVRESAATINATAAALAELDVFAGLAALAVEADWSRPVVDLSTDFAVEAGRHPVVEHALRAGGEGPFIANDCDLGERRLWLLTGPNMAGKSTFLRQNALIAILAQTGSFVPARAARIGVIDRLFSRVGAADDLARGRSTFMVEMVETATILNQAGERSFVILDEIGRGTATFDGLSIAWATVEHLHEISRCRTLFATHYHELTALADRLDGLRNASMAVKEWKGEIRFLHEVRAGAANRSYGVQVARLAGLPPGVIERARAILDALEKGDTAGGKRRMKAVIDDLPLFSAVAARPAPASPVLSRLAALDPDTMTPREALDALYALKALTDSA